MRAIVFDFDGVIQDTFHLHRTKITEFTGFELDEQLFRDMHNGNFFHSAPKEIAEVNWENYRDFIHPDLTSMAIKEEMRDVILRLSEEYELYIISSGGTRNITDYFTNNQIPAVFKEILGFETFKSKIDKFNFIFDKHSLVSDDCLFVTDTLGDILEAHKVGIKAIAVTFGFHDRETLEKGNPYRIINQLSELEGVIGGR